MMKTSLIVLGAVASTAMALPAGPIHHAAPYHPVPYHAAPVPHHAPAPAYKHEKIAPRPFSYAYGVSDEYAGTNFDKKESQDEYGVVHGEYRVALPDGRTQIVTYTADHENGYIADVKYEGVPVHPPVKHAAPYAPKHPAPYHAGRPL